MARHTRNYKTREAAHGTQYRYRVEYSDPDPAAPVLAWHTWAYDLDDAVDNWHESLDGDDWKARRVARVETDRIPLRWAWHAL